MVLYVPESEDLYQQVEEEIQNLDLTEENFLSSNLLSNNEKRP